MPSKTFRKVLESDPKNLVATLGLAVAAGSQGNAKEAEKWLQKAAADHPESVEAQLALVQFYLGSARVPQGADGYGRGGEGGTQERGRLERARSRAARFEATARSHRELQAGDGAGAQGLRLLAEPRARVPRSTET